MRNKSRKSKLGKLTTAALVLLADNGSAVAADIDPTPQANYRLSNYSEAGLEGVDRYDINIQQFRLYKPFDDLYSVNVNAVVETMTGASPWYVIPDQNGKPIQIMSGATIEEKRQDISIGGSRKFEQALVSMSLGNSTENDYKASYVRIGAERDLFKKLVTVFAGLTVSNDTITPTPGDAFANRISKDKKNSRSLFAGFSRIINKKLLFSTSLSYTRLRGFLSDPYKKAYTLDNTGNVVYVNDNRPDNKTQLAWGAKLRYHLGHNMSLHGDYRYFRDNWEISSHTLSATLYETIAVKWRLSQELRYYNQSRAYFYAPFYNGTRSDGFHSSDYRLSPYGAVSARFKLSYGFKNVAFNFAIEKYNSGGDLALKEVTIENPALVDFTVVTIGVDAKFE